MSQTSQSTAQSTPLSEADVSRVIEMAWEDHTPFDAIALLYGLSEPQVIVLMRQNMKPSSFRMWRKRVTGRASKHVARRTTDQAREYAAAQYKIRHGRK
jgi:uncharacterized protein (TIGR03643 family)